MEQQSLVNCCQLYCAQLRREFNTALLPANGLTLYAVQEVVLVLVVSNETQFSDLIGHESVNVSHVLFLQEHVMHVKQLITGYRDTWVAVGLGEETCRRRSGAEEGRTVGKAGCLLGLGCLFQEGRFTS